MVSEVALNEEEDMTSGGISSSRSNFKAAASTAKPSLQSSQKTSPRLPEDNAYQMV